MSSILVESVDWGAKSLSIEMGKIARNCSASVVATYGETSVLVTVTVEKPDNFGFVNKKTFTDGVALVVFFISKSYAMGKFPGGFFKREGKPGERDVLASRLIDRAIRPMIPKSFDREISITCTLIAHDPSVLPEIPALIGASAALSASEVPMKDIVVGAHVSKSQKDLCFELNCDNRSSGNDLDLFVAGTKSSIVAVEGSANQMPESGISEALFFGQGSMSTVFELIERFKCDDSCKLPESEIEAQINSEVKSKISSLCFDRLLESYTSVSRDERNGVLMSLRREIADKILNDNNTENSSEPKYSLQNIKLAFDQLEKEIITGILLKDRVRLDGRSFQEVRQISIESDILLHAHGSSLFTRGRTQSLSSVTLGTQQDEQIVDDIDSDRRESFMLHYNFPPYSVGETSPIRAPGRREIGHGKLAFKAVKPVLPNIADFPYTIRVVSEITESDGSSSMATVCAASLALMNAGVPIKKHVAGVAMGLISTESENIILTDILGQEDHLGDMDFKVAGTDEGVTAVQMDIKLEAVTQDVMQKALEQARVARMEILEKMNAFISSPMKSLKDNAPHISRMSIHPSKVSRVIGMRGKNIKDICESTSSKIDIENDGVVKLVSSNKEGAETAISMIQSLISDPEEGKVYDGIVSKVEVFGAFVKFLGENQGLVHISEIKNERIDLVSDFVSQGQSVKVLVVGFEKGGKVRLSMKRVNQTTGETYDPRSFAASDQSNVPYEESFSGPEIGNSKTSLARPHSKRSMYSRNTYSNRSSRYSNKSFEKPDKFVNNEANVAYNNYEADENLPNTKRPPTTKRKRFF